MAVPCDRAHGAKDLSPSHQDSLHRGQHSKEDRGRPWP